MGDPMVEFEALDQIYRQKKKEEHAASFTARCLDIHHRHQLRLSMQEWLLHTNRARKMQLQQEQASLQILSFWMQQKKRIQMKLITKATIILTRNIFRMVIALKLMSTRSKSFLVQKFVKQAVGPRFKTVIQGLRWKVIKCQRFVRSYL